jgi:YHS domain-containing protein
MATLFTWLLVLPEVVSGAAPWHDDLARAREASRVSRRPVLAIFTAAWQPGGNAVAETVLGTPDAKALVVSCFEPVIIDVDQHVDLTRRLGIRHVPTAAVIGDQDEVLASFECPATTPEFVVAAAQAAQEATSRRDRLEDANRRSGAAHAAGGAGPNASISLVTSKVRQLSDFASEDPIGGGTPAAAPAVATAAAYQQSAGAGWQQPPGDGYGQPPSADRFQRAQDPVAQDTPAQDTPFSRKPPAWPAEQSLAPLATTIAGPPATRPTLEPLPTNPTVAASPTTPALPWLGATASQVTPGGDGESTASVSDMPTGAAGPQAVAVEKKPSPGAQFLAAIQKPFAGFGRKPTTDPAIALPAPPAGPPTLPPARSQWPGAPLAAAPRPAAPAAVPQAQPAAQTQPQVQIQAPAQAQAQTQAQGTTDESMPLGLEGYCPVTLAAKGGWAEGRAQYGVRHRGRTYLFAGAAEQQAFLADPDRYAPALSGDDPVIACEQGRSLPGQRRFGVTCDSRMYLFSSPETRAAFQAHPERYTTRIARAEQAAPTGSRTY